MQLRIAQVGLWGPQINKASALPAAALNLICIIFESRLVPSAFSNSTAPFLNVMRYHKCDVIYFTIIVIGTEINRINGKGKKGNMKFCK